MRVSVYSKVDVKQGKHSVRDARLDEVDAITKAKKKTYVQVELTGSDGALEADAVLAAKSDRADLILKDLDFVETRLGRGPQEAEKAVLEKLKAALEKEEFACSASLSDEEKKMIAGYGLLTAKPVILFDEPELADIGALLRRALEEAGFISFFTTGEKETRAWLIKKGANAWEAAGAVHSDIQRGFIRAEIIGLEDFLAAGGEARAKQAGKLRLENKDYVMQYGDLANFRFNR